MINRVEITRPSDIEARLPVSTDQEIKNIFRVKIEHIRSNVELPVRMGRPSSYLFGEHLFSFTGEEFSHLEGMHWRDGKIGRVESDRLQTLGLEVMKEYGLDENISRPAYHDGGWTKDGIIDDRNGNSREMRLYPSQAIDGLAFMRTKQFVNATSQILLVSWSVEDGAPLFRINLRKKAKK